MEDTQSSPEKRLRDKADDVSREVKSIQRRVRLLGRMAAELVDDTEDYIQKSKEQPTVE